MKQFFCFALGYLKQFLNIGSLAYGDIDEALKGEVGLIRVKQDPFLGFFCLSKLKSTNLI